MSLITKAPRITLKTIANRSTKSDPRWSLSTTYNDWTVELEIDHSFAHDSEGEGYKTFLWVDGDVLDLVTEKELQCRVEIAEEHGDVYDVTQVHAVKPDDGLMRVKAELIARWNAIQFIVAPSVCI